MKRLSVVLIAIAALSACGGDDSPGTTQTPTPSPVFSRTATATATITPALTEKPTPEPTLTPAPTPALEPTGFPIDPATILGVVEGDVGSRQLVFDGSGPTAFDYAMRDQTSSDPVIANRSGWNCETHYGYESAPAEDFYIPLDTPVIATLDGTATLNVISPVNDFDRYGVSREPYIGNPDRSRAPYSPFPGPSGGMGVYVHIENSDFAADFGHLDIAATVKTIPASSFIGGYSPSTEYATQFAGAPEPRVITTVAQWQVHKGDAIGKSGDAGYSEGPHLHYQLRRTAGPLRCPTTEADFTDGGWLFR